MSTITPTLLSTTATGTPFFVRVLYGDRHPSTDDVRYSLPEQHSFPMQYSRPELNRSLEESARLLFQTYSSAWRAETAGFSSIKRKKQHPAYGRIIDLGPVAIKFMLEDMVSDENAPHWFTALKELSGTDPVPDDKRGLVAEMKKSWVEWGRKHGYIK